MAEILIRGKAEARLAPTSATMTVTVRVGGARTQSDAVQRAAERATAVDAIVDAARDGLVKRAITSSLRTGQEWDYTSKGGRRLIGYHATRSAEVECEPDGDRLTSLVAELAGMKEVQVAGPRWHIAPDAAGYDQLRTDAAADARRKAEAYAAGLSCQVGLVKWIAEPGLRLAGSSGGASGPPPMPAAAAPRAMRTSAAEEGEEPVVVRIRPEPITVTATVEVGFELSAG